MFTVTQLQVAESVPGQPFFSEVAYLARSADSRPE